MIKIIEIIIKAIEPITMLVKVRGFIAANKSLFSTVIIMNHPVVGTLA
ncbi:hypothetical protein CNEONATNEC26_03244 [Clostridium neonatale]|nr:hypothetical protein CNEONATNEC26_03244 [Clostridium neonatale]